MSGTLIESENDSDVSSKESMVSKPQFGPRTHSGRSLHFHDNSHEVYKVQQKLENYTRRLSQLGLGLDSEHSSDISELLSNRSSSSMAEPILQASPTLDMDAEISNTDNREQQQQQQEERLSSPLLTLRRSSTSPNATKIQIKFQPIGSIPSLKPNTCKISSNKPFSIINIFLKKRLKVDHVFCYINNSFAPSPNEQIGDLWAQFKINDELIISYCAIVAFG